MAIDLKEANHNERELELMLKKKKPLAMFYAEISELPDEELIPEANFEPHINSQNLVRSEFVVSGPRSPISGKETKIKYVLFALKDEAWRVDAMTLLKKQFEKTGKWNETCERMECFLLGYSEEETDAWCSKDYLPYAP
jgi:hypothetical protein